MDGCAEACRQRAGCKFFIYGLGPKTGRCYAEETPTEDCEAGWEADLYDFYALRDVSSTASDTLVGRGLRSGLALESLGTVPLAAGQRRRA